MKKFIAEFKKFINKGNAIDLAVGVVVGSAFTAVVNSIVNGIIMPFITALTGNSFANWVWVVNGVDQYLEDGATINPEAIIVSYGMLIQALLNFLLVALTLFFVVKAINKLRDSMTPKYFGYEAKEYRQMRKEGKTKAQIEAMAKERDAKAEEERKIAEAEAKRHTTEGLLEDIKALLEKQANK
ncbi:MAG: large conductance mechanosensitive channel protein MscL [Clostridia bacterium]|nr:large conductance mechanosensitive channel protein MscL [Clostridia bacterium]